MLACFALPFTTYESMSSRVLLTEGRLLSIHIPPTHSWQAIIKQFRRSDIPYKRFTLYDFKLKFLPFNIFRRRIYQRHGYIRKSWIFFQESFFHREIFPAKLKILTRFFTGFVNKYFVSYGKIFRALVWLHGDKTGQFFYLWKKDNFEFSFLYF